MSGTDDQLQFWYCIKHGTVEGHDGCPNKERLGPYATDAEAARALQTAAERTEAWDRESDAEWDDEQLED